MYRQPGFWVLVALVICWGVWVATYAPKAVNNIVDKMPENITQNFNNK